MNLFSRKPSAHRVEIHFAQPMTPRLRQQHEKELIEQLLPQHKASGTILGSGTAITDLEEPVSSDVSCEITCTNFAEVLKALHRWLESNGIARGSWYEADGKRTSVGTSEYILLRTRLARESDAGLEATVLALHRALGDGEIGWHEDVYFRSDGPVFVFNGDSGQAILDALSQELVKHPLLQRAELVAVTTS